MQFVPLFSLVYAVTVYWTEEIRWQRQQCSAFENCFCKHVNLLCSNGVSFDAHDNFMKLEFQSKLLFFISGWKQWEK